MPTFILWRTFDASLADEDYENLLVRSIATSYFDPPFRWQRSFDFPGAQPPRGFCVYKGPSKRDLHWQQRLCWIPFDEIREVEETLGPSAGPLRDEAPADWPLFLVERHFADGVSPDVVRQLNSGVAADHGAAWARSFCDTERSTSACLFFAESEEQLRAAVDRPGAELLRVNRLEQAHPSEVAELFDRLGVPHYWETAEVAAN